MTGRVVLVPVQVGSLVDKGDVLIVVEAMKMEHALKAPKAGVVASIAATVGQLVEGGVELVVLADPIASPGEAS
jgi:3-methylcrotonyl-CoA carboxylase alpha subunit